MVFCWESNLLLTAYTLAQKYAGSVLRLEKLPMRGERGE